MKLNKDSLTTAVQVREYLAKEGYASPDTWGGRAKLSYTLLSLLHAVPQSVLPKLIRAVVTLLECEEAVCTTDTITAAILHKIDLALNLMGKAADQMQGVASGTRMVADWLYRTGEEMRDELQKGADMAFKDIQKATACLKDEVRKLNVAAVSATNGMGDMGDRQHDMVPGHATYADALNRQLLLAHPSTLTISQVKERQVLIDKDLAVKLNQLDGLNE